MKEDNMDYRDKWTNDHGEDGLRHKFDVYKSGDIFENWPPNTGLATYPQDERIGSSGEFVFVLRPESDYAAYVTMITYCAWVEFRAPQLAEDIRKELRRINANNPEGIDPPSDTYEKMK